MGRHRENSLGDDSNPSCDTLIGGSVDREGGGGRVSSDMVRDGAWGQDSGKGPDWSVGGATFGHKFLKGAEVSIGSQDCFQPGLHLHPGDKPRFTHGTSEDHCVVTWVESSEGEMGIGEKG